MAVREILVQKFITLIEEVLNQLHLHLYISTIIKSYNSFLRSRRIFSACVITHAILFCALLICRCVKASYNPSSIHISIAAAKRPYFNLPIPAVFPFPTLVRRMRHFSCRSYPCQTVIPLSGYSSKFLRKIIIQTFP